MHLLWVVKDKLRNMDVIACFGGEKFMIVLLATPLDKAAETMTLRQRELTNRFFMHDNNKLLFTFSAGGVQRSSRGPGDADPACGRSRKPGQESRQALAKLRQWNEQNPDSKIAITPAQIKRRVMQMKLSQADRFIRTVSKEMRAQTLKDLN
jgi:hypothetical protein